MTLRYVKYNLFTGSLQRLSFMAVAKINPAHTQASSQVKSYVETAFYNNEDEK